MFVNPACSSGSAELEMIAPKSGADGDLQANFSFSSRWQTMERVDSRAQAAVRSTKEQLAIGGCKLSPSLL